jgi:hypothetical protein
LCLGSGLSSNLPHLEKTAQMASLASGPWFCATHDSPEKVNQHLLISFCVHHCRNRYISNLLLLDLKQENDCNFLFKLKIIFLEFYIQINEYAKKKQKQMSKNIQINGTSVFHLESSKNKILKIFLNEHPTNTTERKNKSW